MLNKNRFITSTFDWYLQNVLPIVSQNAIQRKYGYHGLYTHTSAVVFRGIDYALALGQNPKPVVLACAFHDMARINDYDDLEHGKNAIPLAQRLLLEIPYQISPIERNAIMFAVENHSLNLDAPDYISACLWDADRTRISWECGYEDRFFTTQRAKQIASSNGDKYITFMAKRLSEYAHSILTDLNKQY